jgi:hypothetical protein
MLCVCMCGSVLFPLIYLVYLFTYTHVCVFPSHACLCVVQCVKLEYLAMSENEVAANIPRFRLFLVHNLPKLKYVNWDQVNTKERTQAAKLAQQGIWKITVC